MPLRPFWRHKSRAASPHQDGTQLTQKLDEAEKKIDEYSRLIASLFAELRRYQDTICHTCKGNVTRASLAAGSQPISLPVSQPIVGVPLITASVQTATEPSFPTSSSSGAAHDLSSGSSPIILVESPTHGNNNTMDNFTPVISSPQITVTTALPVDSDRGQSRQPSQSTIETEIARTQPTDPDWSVEYNPEIKKILNIHIADTFTFPYKVYCTRYSRDGRYLAVGLESGAVYIYDIMMGRKEICVLVERTATVFYTDSVSPLSSSWTVRFSLDNKYIATGGTNGQINIWEIDRQRLRAIFEHSSPVRCIDFSPNSHVLVSASWDDSVCLWAIRDGSRRTLYQHNFHSFQEFISVAFSPNGRYVAAGSSNSFVVIWDVRTGRLLANCQIYNDPVGLMALVFTRNGQGIAIGGNTVQFGDISSLKDGRHIIMDDSTISMKQFFQSKDLITALSFSSDNRWVLSASFDSNIHILDAESGAWVCTLKGHTDVVWGAGFSPAGHYIVSGSDDCRVRLWRYDMVE